MTRRIILEITDEEYKRLQTIARHARIDNPEHMWRYNWKAAAQDALTEGIQADWEFGAHGERQD